MTITREAAAAAWHDAREAREPLERAALVALYVARHDLADHQDRPALAALYAAGEALTVANEALRVAGEAVYVASFRHHLGETS